MPIVDKTLARLGLRVSRIPDPGQLGPSYPDLDAAFADVYARAAPFTMTSPERMYALWGAVRHICRHDIPGDLVECGVWRGGSSMVAALALAHAGDQSRRLWLYDTFEGMNTPTERDVSVDGLDAAAEWEQIRLRPDDPTLAAAGIDDVRANMASTGIAPDRLEYVVGPVEDTIPMSLPDRIAVLRLDTDWYESTRHELKHLWDLLEPGGLLIVDDYGHWAGARQAIDEFFAGRTDSPFLGRIDYTGRIGVKRGT